jgi:hypothetical protein
MRSISYVSSDSEAEDKEAEAEEDDLIISP